MIVAVYHQGNPIAMLAPERFQNLRRCTRVATVATRPNYPAAALESAFRQTQNTDNLWIRFRSVRYLPQLRHRGGCRSTSVGDIFRLSGDRFFQVTPDGLVQLAR